RKVDATRWRGSELIARGPGEGVTSEGYGLETMPSQDADGASRAGTIARRLATPCEVAEYLHGPRRPCTRGATSGWVRERIALPGISDSAGRTWRIGSGPL